MNDQVISLVFGPVAVWLVQKLKGVFGFSGIAALWLAMVVSILLGGVAAIVSGNLQPIDLSDPLKAGSVILANASIVFSTATVIYRYVKEHVNGGQPSA